MPPCGRTWPHWPPGPSNEDYLSSPHLEASPATTFRACSSLAPTPVKPQHAPAILSQESVHTTLSITHHTRKRPSTGPRTTHGPQSPPWWVHWQHQHKVRYSIASYRSQLHDHQVSQPLDKAKMDLGNFAKNLPLMRKVLSMIETCQNGKTTQTPC
jgi:hypothetical protein